MKKVEIRVGTEFAFGDDKAKIVEVLEEPNTGLVAVEVEGRAKGVVVPVAMIEEMLNLQNRVKKGVANWGVGDQFAAKPFATVMVGNTKVDLIHGQFPHGRQDHTIYARWPDGDIEGFSGHRQLVSYNYEQANYLKTSGLSGNEVRKSGMLKIFVDGDLIHATGCRTLDYSTRLLPVLLEKLAGLPCGLFSKEDRAKLIGRKIYYDGVPAKITTWWPNQGAVMIESEGRPFPCQPWRHTDDGKDKREEWGERTDEVKDDILSSYIWWFRD